MAWRRSCHRKAGSAIQIIAISPQRPGRTGYTLWHTMSHILSVPACHFFILLLRRCAALHRRRVSAPWGGPVCRPPVDGPRRAAAPYEGGGRESRAAGPRGSRDDGGGGSARRDRAEK